ncbi:MAG: efflux RND transporter permease subunit, partial [Clostridiales bacterium]|nr:efflux RND transporter permease subunit [Clostridiales bacterium]
QELFDRASEAAANLASAQLLYDESSEEVTRAQADFDEANAALNEATLSAANVTPEQIDSLRRDLDELSSMLASRADSISGSTINELIETTSGLSSLMTRVSETLGRVRQADPAGSLSERVDSANQSVSGVNSLADSIPGLLAGLQTAATSLTQGQLDAAVGFSTATTALSDARAQLDAAQAQYDSARQTALENANADQFLTPQTLSQLIYAQNFAMPVGYIDDAEDNSWLLKVGDEFSDSEDLAGSLLLDNEMIGTIRLEDVADIAIIDNADDSYTRLNGNSGIILCIYKSSSAGTNDVSNRCNNALSELSELYPGTHSINLVDQGDYIRMIVSSVFQSIIIGAALAIIILALFLKDIKPTIVVAISIPLSVLLAIVLMYFTGLELNMMTLSGLALGIGMLVDNSVVVMENIFRLRGKGLPAPRAAVQGAKQVRGSIIASTLTTICVFLPAVFSDGTVRTLMYPMAFSIGYCLIASLGIAMTVVPASCSTLMRKTAPKEHKLFDRILKVYGRSLRWCLRYKIAPLSVAILLLAFSVYEVFETGIVYIPNITSNEISITLTTPEDMSREDSYATIDDAMQRILSVDGITDLGIMDSGSSSSFLMASAASDGSYGSYMCYALAEENSSASEIERIGNDISSVLEPLPLEAEVATGGSMGSMNLMGSSGLTVNIYGNDYTELHRISDEVKAMLESNPGFESVSDSFSDLTPTLHLVIDRDKAMSYGLTVAQIYAGIAARTSTNITSTSISVNGVEMDVTITDDSEGLTRENLLDIEFEAVDMTAMASSDYSGSSSLSSMSGSVDMSLFEGPAAESEASDEETPSPTPTPVPEAESNVHKLSEFAYIEETFSSDSVRRENLTRYVSLTAIPKEGENTTLLSRDLKPSIDKYSETLPNGYSIEMGGEYSQVMDMVYKMCLMAALAFLFIYLIMVAQFQSLLSPLIILFTIPLAFTGGMIGLLVAREQLSMLSLLGFVVLMGTVVNNGIVFVDFANQLRIGGLERREALVATGITRMRPILMTALTTILAMSMMIFGTGMSSQLGRGMAIVISGGLLYATLMTLYIVPVMYDILFKRKPLNIDVGSDIDEVQDDAADYLANLQKENEKAPSKEIAVT